MKFRAKMTVDEMERNAFEPYVLSALKTTKYMFL